MLKRILIAANVLLLVTACAIPITKNHDINTAMERYATAYRQIVKNDPAAEDNIDTMGEILAMVDRQYVDQVDPQALIDKAIAGLKAGPKSGNDERDPTTRALNAMLASLDRYTGYMTPASFENYQESLGGHFVGLGIHIQMIDGKLTVMSLLKGSGAEEAGLKAGDVIAYVDGAPISNMSLSHARKLLRGPAQSVSLLSIIRKGSAKPLNINVTRRPVELTAVEHHVDGNVGYIRIYSFTSKTGPGVTRALNEFETSLGPNLCGVILDMRNNPGGLVSAAETVASAFLDGGNIYAVTNRGRTLAERDADNGDITKGVPVVVMMNRNSASSSEIVAGALKYHHRAKLYGEKSFGKGLMQSLVPLHNGGGLRLTTGRFTTAGGPTFHGIGLKPDIPDAMEDTESDKVRIARAAQTMKCSTTLTTAMANSQ